MQNQAGSIGRLVTWVNQAWNEVQTEHDDWIWMRSTAGLGAGMSFVPAVGLGAFPQASFPLGTTAGTTCGVDPTKFGKWVKNSFRNYTTSVGPINEIFMDQISYDDWYNVYLFGANRSVQTRPVAIATGPDESICLGPPSNGLYTITGDYIVAPTLMSADTDVPNLLPNQYHMLIVYKAMQKYGMYESAPEVVQRGEMEYGLMLAQLEAIKMEEIGFAGGL